MNCIYKRGEIAFKENESIPICAKSLYTKLFWLGQNPLSKFKKYDLKIGHAKIHAVVSKINKSIDANSLDEKLNMNELHKNNIGECILILNNPIAFDLDILETARFVIVDDYEICGGGYILSVYFDKIKFESEQIHLRNQKWMDGPVSIDNRINRHGHFPKLILVTGNKDAKRKQLAIEIEKLLFESSYYTYYLEMNNLLHSFGVKVQRQDYIKCFSEVAYLFLSAGLILVVSAIDILPQEINIIKKHLNGYELISVYMGDFNHTEFNYSMILGKTNSSGQDAELVLKKMNFSINFRG